MHVSRGSLVRIHALSVFLLSIVACLGPVMAQAQAQAEDKDEWSPQSRFEGKFDWIQMKSGEWVKGELIAMYDEELEFDSDEFDELTLDWEKIRQIRTSHPMAVGLLSRRSVTGILVVNGDEVTVIGAQTQKFARNEVISIAVGTRKEIHHWSMKVYFGILVREGNSDVREANVQANFQRRTVRDRITIDFIGNENTTDDLQVSDNQRANGSWDRFINDRVFVTPVFAEYFRDPFQNIASRVTLGTGAGYQLMDSRKVDWDISGGPGYQQTLFDSVDPGASDDQSTPALTVDTTANWDITKWLEFDGQFRVQITNEASGTYNHHLVVSFETDITKLIDFDISWIWDRIEDPQPDSDGIVPQQNDFRTTVGLTFDF